MITVLAGGVGAAKFLEGLAAVMPPEDITIIANTGDDACFHGLHISPDIDTVMYTLAGVVDQERGWGIAADSFHCLEALRRLGEQSWFNLGDRDLATHLRRSRRLREGATLSEVTRELCDALGVRCRILPMTNDLAGTRLRTSAGMLSFQEYFVKLRQEPDVLEVDLTQALASKPAPGVLESMRQAEAIILAPSNPFISIGPILAVAGVRQALRETPAPIIAISPIVAGKALKGPADRMLKSLGFQPSACAVAEIYREFLDVLVVDLEDAGLCQKVERGGIKVLVTQSVMSSREARQELARAVMDAVHTPNARF